MRADFVLGDFANNENSAPDSVALLRDFMSNMDLSDEAAEPDEEW